ncbi:hypothetical protein [Halobaculum magnesiiphilum]|uniref:Uncharacterized protein n=1 Tax=Halobaculum magnesiiphilum TaxID=1017351 RepID=A0A8T8WB50_9EURY|nr:hypothetical protein [Halobaculum magnesiiphilum]QZP37060.1 hypothetical protein K6T50_12275 [Halobaculum magnesiiphilum]
MSTSDRVLVPQDSDDDEPEVRFDIDENEFRSGEVELTLRRGNERERFRVTDDDVAIYEGTCGMAAWCESMIRRLGLHLDVITE